MGFQTRPIGKNFVRVSKYNNVSTRCKLDHRHDSKGEAQYCFMLQAKKNAGMIKDFEYEKRYILRVNDKEVCGHKPDFTVYNHDGSIEIHEFKGVRTDSWLVRWKLMKALFPDYEFFEKTEKDLRW